jgi:hypothetical protein
LNSQTWEIGFTAVVDDTPYYTTEELEDLRVTILPFGLAWDVHTRTADKLIHTVEISFQKKGPPQPPPPDVDPLIDMSRSLRRLQRDVAMYLRKPANRTPPMYPHAMLLNIKDGKQNMTDSVRSETEHKPLYSAAILGKERTFIGVLHLTYVETVGH